MSGRSGFTLVELVIVILILGILAAIAVPKVFNNADDAADSGAAQTLATLRDAVELYKTQTNAGGYPQGSPTEVRDKLLPFIRGTKFPKVKVGGQDSNVIKNDTNLTVGGTEGWVYDSATGNLIINSNEFTQDGVTKYSEL